MFFLCFFFGFFQVQGQPKTTKKSKSKSSYIAYQSKTTKIIWDTQFQEEIVNVHLPEGEVKLSLKVRSLQDISREDILIAVNGKKLSLFEKGGEDNFFTEEDVIQKYKKYDLEINVPLDQRENDLEIKIQKNQKILCTYNKKIVNHTLPVSASNNNDFSRWNINWGFSDIENNQLEWGQKVLPIDFGIETETAIYKHDISVFLDNSKINISKWKLTNIGFEYRLVGSLDLKNNPNGKIYIQINREGVEKFKSPILHITPPQPRLFILSIGPRFSDLNYNVKDAVEFTSIFSNQSEGFNALYKEVIPISLINENAEKGDVQRELEKLKSRMNEGKMNENDLLIFYISSHGFLLHNDYRIKTYGFEKNIKESTSLSYKEDIINQVDKLNCQKLIFIDACKGIPDFDNRMHEFIRPGIKTITSSSAGQNSYEISKEKNSAFTRAIILGLKRGKANSRSLGNNDGLISVSELFSFLSDKVPSLARKEGAQNPKFYGYRQDADYNLLKTN